MATARHQSTSIEGNGRFTVRDRKNFFGIARGSVQECVPLLELTHRRSLIEAQAHLNFKADLEEIAKMISRLIHAADRRHEANPK